VNQVIAISNYNGSKRCIYKLRSDFQFEIQNRMGVFKLKAYD